MSFLPLAFFNDRGETSVGVHLLELSPLPLNFSVREFMAFTSEVLVQRTDVGERRTVKEQGKKNLNSISYLSLCREYVYLLCTVTIYGTSYKPPSPITIATILRLPMPCICAVWLPGLCGDSWWRLSPQSYLHTHEQGVAGPGYSISSLDPLFCLQSREQWTEERVWLDRLGLGLPQCVPSALHTCACS